MNSFQTSIVELETANLCKSDRSLNIIEDPLATAATHSNMASTNLCLFSAVSPAARDLTLLLRCIAFASKTQVRLSPEGLRFSAQETSVMEGKRFLTILRYPLTVYSLCVPLEVPFHNLELPRSRSS